MHSEFLVPIGICHLGSLSLPSWGPPSPPYLSPSIPFPLLRKAEIWVTVLAGPMQAGSLPRLPLFLKGHVSQGDKALKSRAHYMLRAWPDSERKLRGTPCPQHSQDKVLGSEREGEQGPDSRRSQEVGPSPPLSLGPPNKQMWVMEVSLRATCNHCKDLTLCKDIWGFSQHQGGPMGREG